MKKKASAVMNTGATSYYFYSVLIWALGLTTVLVGGCAINDARRNPYYDARKPHHTPQGFKNNYTASADKPFSDFVRWQVARWRADLPPKARVPAPTVAPDLPLIARNTDNRLAMQPTLTFVGHASMLVQASGLNVLTDPVFSQRASPVQFAGPARAQPPGLQLTQLPAIDVVLISHSHYDHLDKSSVIALNAQSGGKALFLVPLGIKPFLAGLGITNVKELDWWEQAGVINARGETVEFNLTPVQHWSSRSLGDRNATLWGGWAVLGADFHWYFSGDTGYSRDFIDTRERFAELQTPARGGGFDVALIAIGAYEPRWFMREQHVNPAEAVQMHRDLAAKRSIGVHWGTFALTDEPLDQPPIDLALARAAQSLAAGQFDMMAIGETRAFRPRTRP